MNNPQVLFLSIVISIGVFLLLREVFCWYFKINKRISLLSDIKDELVQANGYANPNKEPTGPPKSMAKASEEAGVSSAIVTGNPKSESFWMPR
jgi:hypothetical protein